MPTGIFAHHTNIPVSHFTFLTAAGHQHCLAGGRQQPLPKFEAICPVINSINDGIKPLVVQDLAQCMEQSQTSIFAKAQLTGSSCWRSGLSLSLPGSPGLCAGAKWCSIRSLPFQQIGNETVQQCRLYKESVEEVHPDCIQLVPHCGCSVVTLIKCHR